MSLKRRAARGTLKWPGPGTRSFLPFERHAAGGCGPADCSSPSHSWRSIILKPSNFSLIVLPLHTPKALWLSLRYTPALGTWHARGCPRSPADGLISYPVARRTTKLTQLMPRDRPSARDRRGDCQRLLNRPRRDVRKAVLREPDSALLPSSGSLPDRRSARSRRGDSGRLPPSTPWTRCVLQPFFARPRPGRVKTSSQTSGSRCSVCS